MNRPTIRTDTAEAWRAFAVHTNQDTWAQIDKRRRDALRESFPRRRRRERTSA